MKIYRILFMSSSFKFQVLLSFFKRYLQMNKVM